MPTVLIVGASRGIGLGLAEQYAIAGCHVHATYRGDQPPSQLAALKGDISLHRLDVSNPDEIAALASGLGDSAIDLCIHNAGIHGAGDKFGELKTTLWMQILNVNTVAPVMVAQAVMPRILASTMKTIVFISSDLGSIGRNTDAETPVYRSSKAGLNAAVRCIANQYKPQGVTAVVMHPGWVRTDMGGPEGTLSTQESCTAMRDVISSLSVEQSGRFWNYNGEELAW